MALGYVFIVAISLALLPNCKTFDASRDIVFELHTRENNTDNYQRLVPNHHDIAMQPFTNFNSSRPTRIYVHGYLSIRNKCLRYSKAFLQSKDCNFILVNWLNGSMAFYASARNRVDKVAIALAELINFLVRIYDMRLSDLIVIGHSLGAHVVGVAGTKLKPMRLPIIIGLDPAYPMFSTVHIDLRLSSDDAEYVQVIHTNGARYGLSFPMGDADFYPNWGQNQPGCFVAIKHLCSHARSHKLYIESLSPKSFFDSMPCESYEEILEGRCTLSGPTVLMGGDDPEQLRLARGIYYTSTRENSPYALNHTRPFDEEYYY